MEGIERLKLAKGAVIHCPTEELSNKVLAVFDSVGLTWASGDSYATRGQWLNYQEGTCYCPSSGTYCSKGYFTSNGYQIVSAEQFLLDNGGSIDDSDIPVTIAPELLREMVGACTEKQLDYLRTNIDGFTGKTTKKKLKGLYAIACSGWKRKMEEVWPWLAEKEYPKEITSNDLGYYTCRNGRTARCTAYDYYAGVAATEKQSKALAALAELLFLRAKFLETDGYGMDWVPEIGHGKYFAINNTGDGIAKRERTVINVPLSFPTEQMRDTFFEYFPDLLEKAKSLI